jgi:hypothetical protein
MEETSCKKSCAQCTYRAKLNCDGCGKEPSKPAMGMCEVYRCALGRGYEHCGQCGKGGKCPQRNPVKTVGKAMPDADRNAYLGRWLMVLFLLFIPNNIGSLISDDSLKDVMPGLFMTGKLLSFASQIAYGIILLKMSNIAQGYCTAGVCSVIMTCVDGFFTFVVGITEMPFLVSLVVIVIGLVGMYNEYNGHAAVLYQSNKTLAAKWTSLWNWTLGLYALMIFCPMLVFAVSILGLLGTLISLIGVLVVMIMKLVYLWQSAQYYKNC